VFDDLHLVEPGSAPLPGHPLGEHAVARRAGNVRLVGMSKDEFQKEINLRVGPTVNGVAQIFILPQDIIDNTVKAFNVSATSANGYGPGGAPAGRRSRGVHRRRSPGRKEIPMLVPLERNLSPEQVDARLRQAHRARRSAERALAFYLKEVNDRRLFQTFGFASIRHYAREAADLTGRQTRELLRVAEQDDRVAVARLEDRRQRQQRRRQRPPDPDACPARHGKS